jgi:hypothetical protein
MLLALTAPHAGLWICILSDDASRVMYRFPPASCPCHSPPCQINDISRLPACMRNRRRTRCWR